MAMSSTDPRRAGSGLAWLGLLLVIGGVVGYFVAVLALPGLPWIRNAAIPNWLLIGAGLAVGAAAARRAHRRSAKVLLGVDVALAGLFGFMLYGMSAVPHADGPAVGTPAPDFALADQTGRMVRLSELRGAPVLLVFYRGHW